jgi:hypothetical protein
MTKCENPSAPCCEDHQLLPRQAQVGQQATKGEGTAAGYAWIRERVARR